jgi:hypothetical protein
MTIRRGAICLILLTALLPTGVGCRSGGMSGMKAWWPGQASEMEDAADGLASAPAFEGGIAKPSSKATPYPTTSTPESYVVSEADGSPQFAQSQPSTTATSPPVTYGMQPPELATAGSPAATETPVSPPPSMEAIGEQVGPYQPLASADNPANPSPAPASGAAAGGFAAAGSIAPGAFPPEQPLGAAPPAGAAAEVRGTGSPGDPAGLAASSPPAAAASSAFASTPSGSAFSSPPLSASTAPSQGSSFGGAVEPVGTGSSFAPPAGSFAGTEVPQGATADSPVAGSRFASAAGSGFPSEAVTPQAAETGSQGYGSSAAPWQPPQAALEASPASFGSPAAVAAAASRFGQPTPEEPDAAPPGSAGGVPPTGNGPPATRPGRRPDPMYRPAGTSSYRPAQPIFADDPEPSGPVRMATYEEPVVEPSRQ